MLLQQGFSEKIETDLIVMDALRYECRYPITLKIEGEDNKGEFDLRPASGQTDRPEP